MGLLDFFNKKGKEGTGSKPTSNVQSSNRVNTPSGTQPVSKGGDTVTRAPGHPEQGFYSPSDKQQTTSAGPNQDIYTVQSGDSLSKIAKKHYGDANNWKKVYEANKDKIGDNPDLIRPGQRLVIPRD